jgi:peptidyl-prolyl cis-trans isomerase C
MPVRLLFALFLAVALMPAAACKQNTGKTTAAAATTGQAAAPAGTPAATPAPPKPVPAQLPEVLAKVNGQDVKKNDFEMLVKDMELGQGPIPAERRDEVLRGTLDRLITYTVLSQEAKKRNVTATDVEVDDRLKQMQQQFPDEAAFKKALTERNMTIERLRSDTRDNLVISKMMDAEVATTPGASDAEAKEFYDKNPDKFKQAEQVRASHILIRVDEKADATTKQKARAKVDAVLKRAKAGEDFAKLAKENSADGSAAQGGDLSYFGRGQMVPAFDDAAFKLKPGEISDVVTTQFGYHIIKVTDHKGAATVPLDQVAEKVKQFLSGQKKQEKADAFIAGLKEKSKIEVLM